MDDQVGGCSRAGMQVSVARVLSMVLTLPSELSTVARTKLVPMVVMVVATPGEGAEVTSMMFTPAGDEVHDSCPEVEAASLVITLMMAIKVLDPIERNVTEDEELIFPPEALVRLVMARLSEVRDANMVCPIWLYAMCLWPQGMHQESGHSQLSALTMD